jgi:hypothetical protein
MDSVPFPIDNRRHTIPFPEPTPQNPITNPDPVNNRLLLVTDASPPHPGNEGRHPMADGGGSGGTESSTFPLQDWHEAAADLTTSDVRHAQNPIKPSPADGGSSGDVESSTMALQDPDAQVFQQDLMTRDVRHAHNPTIDPPVTGASPPAMTTPTHPGNEGSRSMELVAQGPLISPNHSPRPEVDKGNEKATDQPSHPTTTDGGGSGPSGGAD